MKPVLLVIAGPNGAGKTTVTERLRRDHWSDGVEYLNPDVVARDRFGDWNSPRAVLQAARWTTARLEELLAARQGIAVETVFSSPQKVDFVRRAVDAGYFVRVFFVGTSSPEINASRIARRVLAGGHDVPIDRVVARYGKSLANFATIVSIAQRTYAFDNSLDDHAAVLRARTVDGSLRKTYPPVPTWLEGLLAHVPRHPEFFASA